MVDAFYSDGVPFHMTTLEFVRLVRDRLTPGGVVATNVIGALTGGSSQITRALWKTYATVFPTVELHPVYEGPGDRYPGDIRNIILIGTERAAPSPARLAESWDETRRRSRAAGTRPPCGGERPLDPRRRDRRRAASHRRLRADRCAPDRLSRRTDEQTIAASRGRGRRRGSPAGRRARSAQDYVERHVDHLGRRGARPSVRSAPATARSAAATPRREPSTRSAALGVPPRWTWPSTVTRASNPVRSLELGGDDRATRRRAARSRRRRGARRRAAPGGGVDALRDDDDRVAVPALARAAQHVRRPRSRSYGSSGTRMASAPAAMPA